MATLNDLNKLIAASDKYARVIERNGSFFVQFQFDAFGNPMSELNLSANRNYGLTEEQELVEILKYYVKPKTDIDGRFPPR